MQTESDSTPLDGRRQGRAVFRTGSIFYQGMIDGRAAGWYVNSQGGHVYGPFSEKSVAQYILEGLHRRRAERETRADLADSA